MSYYSYDVLDDIKRNWRLLKRIDDEEYKLLIVYYDDNCMVQNLYLGDNSEIGVFVDYILVNSLENGVFGLNVSYDDMLCVGIVHCLDTYFRDFVDEPYSSEKFIQ